MVLIAIAAHVSGFFCGQAWEEKAAELDAEHLDEWREKVAANLTASAWGGSSSALDQARTFPSSPRRVTFVLDRTTRAFRLPPQLLFKVVVLARVDCNFWTEAWINEVAKTGVLLHNAQRAETL